MTNQDYIRTNRLLAGIMFLASFMVYFSTMAPSVSYWDCGEFIAVAYRLGVPHPPGSPLFLLLGRIISMFPFSPDIAFRVNILSPLVSAFAVMFLYLIIVQVINHWKGGITNTIEAIIAFGSAAIGSLVFAFTDSHWFNAVEAEVYAMSTFFTAIVVWLILKWSEKADERGHERYILIIAYMIGLATGLHLLNLLTLPFIALIIYFRKHRFEWKSFTVTVVLTGFVFLIIHNGIIKGLPKIAASAIGVGGTIILISSVFFGMVWAIYNKERLMSVALTSMVLVLVGYSTYALIFIRSNQDPGIDENDPETIEAFISYLEREQYGSVGVFPRRYKGIPPIHEVVGRPEQGNNYSSLQKKRYRSYNKGKQWEFFLNYQIRKMYNRYFLWQFAGRGPATEPYVTAMGANSTQDGVDWTQFGLPLALVLGLLGMFYHGYKDQRMAFSVFTLFIMTGYAIIIYLNQDNPQPRERDYSYVGSFFAFSIWAGIGACAILDKIKEYFEQPELGKRMVVIGVLLQLVFIPGVMLNANYHSHNRSGNFVAWDYSYNILQSCGPNGIIFTNGDNDTFPLWYLQEVEGLRTDVSVVNLSLLNTDWYIKQMRDSRKDEIKFIKLSDSQIDKITSSLTRWETQKVRVPVYNDPKNETGFIEWTMKPTFAGAALRVQDLMIMRIINDAAWKIPIYFAVTVSQSNRIGLDQYLDMQGLTFQLKSHSTKPVDSEKMYENLMTAIGPDSWSDSFQHSDFYKFQNVSGYNKMDDQKDKDYKNWSKQYQPGYMFRNLGNKNVYYNDQVIRLLQNYRSAYMQLAVSYYLDYQKELRKKEPEEVKLFDLKEKTISVLDRMSKNIPEETIPISAAELHYQVARIYGDLGEKEEMSNIMERLIDLNSNDPKQKVEYASLYFNEFNDTSKAIELLQDLHTQFIQIESMVTSKGFGSNSISQKSWRKWQQAYPEIVSSMVFMYRKSNRLSEAEMILNNWVLRNPNDLNAKKILEEIRASG